MLRLRELFCLVFLLGLFAQLSVSAGWASQETDKCRDIWIEGGQQNLQDFPVPVGLESDQQMLQSYQDVRFYSKSCGNGGQQLDFEFEETDSSGIEAWIRVPDLPSSGKTVSVYYDNTTAVSDAESPEQVWDQDFATVQHLENDVSGDGGSFSGSTENQIFGETLNGVSTSSTGIFDGAYDFDGKDDALNFSNSFSYSDTEAFTFTAFFNRTEELDGDDRVFGFDSDSSWSVFLDGGGIDGEADPVVGFNGSLLPSNVSTQQNKFYSTTLRYDGAGTADIFVNGVLENSTTGVEWENPVEEFLLGASGATSLSGSNLSFGGLMDEFRVSTLDRSEAWIEASNRFLKNESAVETGNEIEYVNAVIHSPSRQYIDNTSVRLEVSWENKSDSWFYSIDDGPNRTAGLSGVFYTNSTNHLRVLYGNGTSINFSEQASVVGDQANLDSDTYLEVPFINTSGYLKVIDRFGETSVLDTGQDTSMEVIATGDWNLTDDYVFYPDATASDNLKRVRVGEQPQAVSSGVGSNGALGAADFDVDGSEELVFLGTSNTVKYLDEGTVKSTGFSSFGSNEQYGISQVADVNRDGKPRVAYVTGSNNLALLDYQGNKEKINSNYGLAAKTRISPVDWKGDAKKEILHIGTGGDIKYQFYNGTTEFVQQDSSNVAAEQSVGLASGKQFEINTTLKNFSEGKHNITVYAFEPGIYAQESVSFTVDVSDPEFQNLADNVTDSFYSPDTANISAEAYDQYSGLSEVKLSTNETGSFSNKTVYNSPQEFENISDEFVLSEFFWKNTSFTGELGYRLWASDAADNTAYTSKNSFEVHRIDLEASNVSFNTTEPVEGQDVNLQFNVSNVGGANATANITVVEEEYNGSAWEFVSNSTREEELEASGFNIVNFTVTPDTGPNRYTAYVDSDDSIDEKNESNNNISSMLDVSSYHLKYGNSNSALTLGSGQKLKSWTQSDPRGTIFYSDLEASYSVDDLRPLNESGDLSEADKVLGMKGHNDSLSSIYDEDQDGFADTTGCIDIAGETQCQIPLVNSTNTSNFQTGILYDGAGSGDFNGSQDVVFATEIKDEKQGRYGFYNYEIKVPSPLSSQYSPSDFVDLRVELK
ncbi:CARDB domain-containing protein [Candidatus Nanosalina sp. VS9-1]|uniref:CARDB domain-containing protein n=1 Tax=Candidatus Nanosalina sp. VS9-1 TaxID=3388566 RepID=UPI0039E1BA33